jgi:glycosyltransferase involved in cell wall biosynthesis
VRVTFCWPEISGYMADCWRALHAKPDVDVSVVIRRPASTPFDPGMLAELPVEYVRAVNGSHRRAVREAVSRSRPDVLVLSGWDAPALRSVARVAEDRDWSTVLCFDNPRRTGSWRQAVGKRLFRSYFKRFRAVFVPGERGWQLARYLGFESRQVHPGLLGVNYAHFAGAQNLRNDGDWPRAFGFVGEYIELKGLDVLLEAYSRYRRERRDAWALICSGRGPLQRAIAAQCGVVDAGFTQPADLPVLLGSCGAFVLPSRSDHWGVALVEACAAGLPVIASDQCGAVVEVVRDHYNGLIVTPGSTEDLLEALLFMHDLGDQLPEFGRRSAAQAAPFASDIWAARWRSILMAL